MPTKEWGNITWRLFHTLAAQIDESNFDKVKSILIEVIVTTCAHLPCPTCTKDASDIIKKAKLNNIKTKNDFIEFLRQFHNIVNIKLHKKTFSEKEIKYMYNKVNLINIINLFIQTYGRPSGNMKMIIYNFHKQNFINRVTPKLNTIIPYCGGK